MKIPTNEEKQALWQAYRDRRPTRVPVTYGVNSRMVLLDPAWNPKAVTYQDYVTDADAAIEIQLRFMEYKCEFLHRYCDHPIGAPETVEFYVDNQNTYDSQYFGAPLAFRDGQVADVEPYLAGAGKNRIFDVDIDRPLDNPFIKRCLARYEALRKAAGRLSYRGLAFTVRPPLMGFDGHFTIAVNCRGHELLTDLYEDPPYVRRLLEFIHAGVVARTRALAEAFGEKPFDGPGSFADDSIALISTDMYRDRVLPLHRAWYALWSAGPHAIHLCGDATRHFPTIRDELNVMSFDTGFPVDHGRLREALGEDVEILGGPEVALLLDGAPEAVAARTRAILASGVTRGGRFVLREANNLAPRTPEANLAAMYQTCLDAGTYPAGA